MDTTVKDRKYKLQINIHKAFGNLYRKKHVLIACIDETNEILVGGKPQFYPEGITRLLGGGVHEGETEIVAALRELSEETGINYTGKELIPLGEVEVNAKSEDDGVFNVNTYLFATKIKRSDSKPGDDVKFILGLNKNEFKDLIDKFYKLEDSFWYEGVEGKHSWGDYGKVYGFIHKAVLKELESRSLI